MKNMKQKKAILFGANGFIGSYLLHELLNSPDYSHVTVVVRKELRIDHAKLKMLIGDYQSLPGLKEDMAADEIFIALGTTKKNTPDQRKYYEIDHDYPVLAAKFSKEKGARAVFIVTSVGANVNSSVFYVKTKGKIERDIIALDFAHTHIFRPSMLMGNRKENRPLERMFIKLWSLINPILIGKGLKKYRGIGGRDVAEAMVNAAKDQSEKVKIYHWQEMNSLL